MNEVQRKNALSILSNLNSVMEISLSGGVSGKMVCEETNFFTLVITHNSAEGVRLEVDLGSRGGIKGESASGLRSVINSLITSLLPVSSRYLAGIR